MASLTCYGGVNEIGGNKILVEDGQTRIFLDFGQSFNHLKDYFVEYLQPRTRFGLRDYFGLDLMPELTGLYNEWALQRTHISYKEPEYQGVFITHPHYDHIAHLRYLDQKIPIHMGETARNILNSAAETSKSAYFHDKEMRSFDGSIIPRNDVRSFRTGDVIKVGGIEVEPVHVDHSAPGAYGFIVRTGGGTIAYTGDIRKHGTRPQMTQDFLEKAKGSEPDVLVIEGTRVAPEERRQNFTEPEVLEKGKGIVEGNGFVIAMRYPKDLDRFRTFYQIAKETGRILVITLKTAHLLMRLRDDEALALPDPFNDSSIEVYKREMKIYKDWEKPLLERCVDADWVRGHMDGIVWELDFFNLTELIDIKPGKGACIHSMSEPFEEDPLSEVQDEVLRNWLARFSIEHHQLHASGHSSMEEIFGMIDEIDPKKVVPVHTQHQELFEKTGKAVLPSKGKPIGLI
jgi:ribonuclease J